ncbi:hypothetical protein GCM10009120_44380 [Sphingobacterium siyangense subsp. cladoniae]|uniref:hypothetical protein n=1 Tax=Sphingobacterium siyangense TaxID=459529 RepID=UPI0031F984BE
MTPSFAIYNWLAAGSDPKIGARLFSWYINTDPMIVRIISKAPELHLHMIEKALKAYMNRSAQCNPDNENIDYIPIPPAAENKKDKKPPSLREQFPFLSESDCPPELKIMAADKITAYHKVIEYYNALGECTSDQELLLTVRNLVHWYRKNHLIKKEFIHYRDNGKPLGDHELFEDYKNLQDLRKLSALQLAALKIKVENNIRHLEKQIRKGNRPDLQIAREQKLSKYRIRLQMIINYLK